MPSRSKPSWPGSMRRRPTADLIPALTAAFPGFAFGVAPVDDNYWRDTRTVIGPDDTRVGELRPWMAAELARDGGDVKAVWARASERPICRSPDGAGTSAFVSAPTGLGPANYVQTTLRLLMERRLWTTSPPARWFPIRNPAGPPARRAVGDPADGAARSARQTPHRR